MVSEEASESGSFSRRLRSLALATDGKSPWLHAGFGIFAAATLFMAFYHLPWRDEAGAWLFARDLDLWGLFIQSRHDGHPMLWWLCLKALQSCGFNYLGMMVLNWAFAVTGIWLLFYRSALPLAARLAVAFAPIAFCEVAFVARDYSIAVLLTFWAAAWYRQVREKPGRFCVVLALLANTNLFAFASAAGLSAQFLLEQGFDFGRQKTFSLRPLYTRYLGANLVLLLGAVLLVLQLAPVRLPGDDSVTVPAGFGWSWARLMNQHVFVIFLVPPALALFRRAVAPRVWGGVVTVLIALVPATAFGCFGRHAFMLTLGVVYFCWIYFESLVEGGSFCGIKMAPAGIKAIVTLLIFLGAFWPVAQHLKPNRPFDGRNAASAIIAHNLDRPDTLMVVTDPYRAMSLLLFLHNIRVDYAPPRFGPSPHSYPRDEYLSYFFTATKSLAAVRPVALDLAARNPGKTILVVAEGPGGNLDLPVDDPEFRLEALYQSPPDKTDECYAVFVLEK